jgi:hypothetical protein
MDGGVVHADLAYGNRGRPAGDRDGVAGAVTTDHVPIGAEHLVDPAQFGEEDGDPVSGGGRIVTPDVDADGQAHDLFDPGLLFQCRDLAGCSCRHDRWAASRADWSDCR